MKSEPSPDGWAEMGAHLEDDHGFSNGFVESLTADDARRIHAWAHEQGVFEREGHRHDDG